MGFKVLKGINRVPMTIRVEEDNYNIIEKLSKESNKSINEVINMMIKYAIEDMEK